MERYRTRQGEVIEFVKNEDGTVASFAYYEDEKSDIPVCRTFLKGGMPTRDVVYDREDGEILHTSDYDKDMEDVENPLDDKYYIKSSNPLIQRLFRKNSEPYYQ